jgi:putative sterol carrier protein
MTDAQAASTDPESPSTADVQATRTDPRPESADPSTDGGSAPPLGAVDAAEFARMIALATDEQIAQGINGPQRKMVLDEIFYRMAEHVDPVKAKDAEAVVHWKILDRPDGGYDHYEVVLKDGRCTVTDSPEAEARVTMRVGPVDFLKLVSGKSPGPVMFMTGKLRIEGDLLFASQMTSLFRIPRPE